MSTFKDLPHEICQKIFYKIPIEQLVKRSRRVQKI